MKKGLRKNVKEAASGKDSVYASIQAKTLCEGVYKPVFSAVDCLDFKDRLHTELTTIDLVIDCLDLIAGDDEYVKITVSKRQFSSLAMSLDVFKKNMRRTIEEGIITDKN